MMKKLQLLTLLISGLLVACNSSDGETEEETAPEITYKSLHLVNLPDGINEGTLKEAVGTLNDAVSQTGNTVARYKLWKVTTDDSVFNYFVEGLWPDKATYDQIHEDVTYQITIEENREFLDKVFIDQLYGQVTQVE